MFRHAIVRQPGENFADGLTAGKLGPPDFRLALSQHVAYCKALEDCGVELVRLSPDLAHPDSTFVEDTAVLTSRCAIFTRPGAASRLGEVAAIRDPIHCFYSIVHEIEPPGTLDGGDICEAGSHFFIGVSNRTNEDGARQLGRILSADGFTWSTVDILDVPSILHLKSGIAFLDKNNLLVMEEMAVRKEFSGYNLVRVTAAENYGCNCVPVNDRVLIPSGFPGLQAEMVRRGYQPLPLDMSEFRKMDGGLSCLSLRF